MKEVRYPSKASLMIHSANAYITTLCIHLLVYKEDAWLFTAFRKDHEAIHESSFAPEPLRASGAFVVNSAYQEIAKISGNSSLAIFFAAENIFIDRLWPLFSPLGVKACEIVLHDCFLKRASFKKLGKELR